ncbi:MAG: hypothetical protein ACQES9_01485 [Myxococcota bacterium]
MQSLKREEKFYKVLKFLISFHNPKIVSLMSARGFDKGSLEEGWNNLRKAAGWMFEFPSSGDGSFKTTGSHLLAEIEQWENTWFDVADAALSHKSPQIHQELFKNISTEGNQNPSVIKKISILVDRLEKLQEKKDEASKKALALLQKRGLTEKELEKGKELLHQTESFDMEEEYLIDPELIEEKMKYEEELWAWYLDWRKTARTIVYNANLRKTMGIDEIISEDIVKTGNETDESDFMSFLKIKE